MSAKKDQQIERANQLLQEIRIVLPGTQALLGFEFIALFNESFKRLSNSLQMYHLVNLLLITICTVLLISPVAFQELLEDGENSDRFLRFTSRVITLAMFFLLAGLSGDIFVATNLLSKNTHALPAIAAIFTFVFGCVMWFGVMLVKRKTSTGK
jgi:uncharacterized membrane protein HdeD (DUF308 family)